MDWHDQLDSFQLSPGGRGSQLSSSCCKYQCKRGGARCCSLPFSPRSSTICSPAHRPVPQAHPLLQHLKVSLMKAAWQMCCRAQHLTHAPVRHMGYMTAQTSRLPTTACCCSSPHHSLLLLVYSHVPDRQMQLNHCALVWFEYQKQLLGSFATHCRCQAGQGIPPLLCSCIWEQL